MMEVPGQHGKNDKELRGDCSRDFYQFHPALKFMFGPERMHLRLFSKVAWNWQDNTFPFVSSISGLVKQKSKT